MELKVPTEDDVVVFLFERVVRHLEATFGYSRADAVRSVNEYLAKFTSDDYCRAHGIPVQTDDFFCHIEARSMADRVHYYVWLRNEPNETEFVAWQKGLAHWR